MSSAQTNKPVYEAQNFTLWPDSVEEGSYYARAASRTEIESNYPVTENGSTAPLRWKLSKGIKEYPQLTSDYPLLDALYNLSLEELKLDTRSDGAFNAGAQWEGVWTRDVSYSILLSLAAIQPDAAKSSLMHKVKRDRIVQDTGTGGSWPVSTDRVTWALAAWEIYLTTGDRNWLRYSYTVIHNSVLDDEHVVIDPATGLARGESTFLDWREQTYPRWMEPADIYQSKNLGTNAVYYRVYCILAAMASELGKRSQEWDKRAERIRSAINEYFWVKERGYYGQYLYGRLRQTLSPRADALGESLTVLFDIATPEQQDRILRSQPLMEYGIPTVYPETPNIRPYHNRSTWPFVQAFWNLAAAKREDETALVYGLASIYRASALFLTNKENFVVDTGSPVGTAINSDRQLWSVAGNHAMIYRVLFGMKFAPDGLHLHPVIPEALKGTWTLTNFHYRKAVLTLQVKGFGGNVKRVLLDGKPSLALVPADLSGRHDVVIELDGKPLRSSQLNLVKRTVAPETPVLSEENNRLLWNPVEEAVRYQVYRNGKFVEATSSTSFEVPESAQFAEYQVTSVDRGGNSSFLSAPESSRASAMTFSVENDPPAPYNTSAQSLVALDNTESAQLSMGVNVPSSGRYSLSFRYANGSGPLNTDNKCAIRTLFIDGKAIGPIVFPQRGQDEWRNWGVSSIQTVHLSAGLHQIELQLLPFDTNMNGEVNGAIISSLSLTRLD